jgi:hypothetical protein
VKLDVDEVLSPGWRDALEQAPPADRYQYLYVWSHDADGDPDVQFMADHTTTRHNWLWEHPVHEALRWCGDGVPRTATAAFTIDHWPDSRKSRSSYLPLLEKATQERPDDDRMAHYYARELYFRGDWVKSRAEFIRHLALPSSTWAAERAQSYRYLAKMDDYPERWLLKAVAEAPDRREAWVDLVDLALVTGDPVVAAGYARRALRITGTTLDYITEAHAWDDARLREIAG